MTNFKGLTEQDTYINLAEALDFARYLSNSDYYYDTEVDLWACVFDKKLITDSEIWDEFRKSKQINHES